MKRVLVAIAVAAQVATLAFMAAQREWVVRTGEAVFVRTAPVDPNDPMRGDYARLHYEISSVPRALCRDGVASWFQEGTVYSREVRDRRVYALLERDESGIASVVGLTDVQPGHGLYLRGRTDWMSDSSIQVRYGIEAFFMEQGRALEFENLARERVGVPVDAEVVVGAGGMGVLRAYHWEPLGIAIELRRRPVSRDAADAESTRVRAGVTGAVVTLKNYGVQPVAIVDLPRGRSFHLVPAANRGEPGYLPVDTVEADIPVEDAHVVVLQPGVSHTVELDFTRPEWFLRRKSEAGGPAAEAVPMESLENAWSTWLRVEYRPPSAQACSGLLGAGLIRHARLRSRAFNASAGMD